MFQKRKLHMDMTIKALFKYYLLLSYVLNFPSLTWSNCITVTSTPQLTGHFCPDDDNINLPFVLEYECTLICAHRTTCAATNYNTSENTCDLLPATCPQTRSDPLMIYTIFTVDRGQCLEWQPYNQGTNMDERWAMASVGGNVICRLLDRDNIYPGYLIPHKTRCYATNGVDKFFNDDYPCQVLRVREGCTAAFVSYTAGDVLPHGVAAITSPAGGQPRYIAAVGIVAGYYTTEANGALYLRNGMKYTTQMELLVVIWTAYFVT